MAYGQNAYSCDPFSDHTVEDIFTQDRHICLCELIAPLTYRSFFHVDISVKISHHVDAMSTYNTTGNFVNTLHYAIVYSKLTIPSG